MARPVVLVHGAWHGPWCWTRVVQGLEARGLEVRATELHRGSLAADTAAVQADVDALGAPALVCGHSYGGIVITGLRPDRVAHLAFLCAGMPRAGEDMTAHLGDVSHLRAAMQLEQGSTLATVDPARAPAIFYNDCTPEDAAWAVSQLRDQELRNTATSPERTCWEERPSTYIVCTRDAAIDPARQRELARRATHTRVLETDHSPFLSQPKALVDLLAELAETAD